MKPSPIDSQQAQWQTLLLKKVASLLKAQKSTAVMMAFTLLLSMASMILIHADSGVMAGIAILALFLMTILIFMVYARLLRPLSPEGIVGRIIAVELVLGLIFGSVSSVPILLPRIDTAAYINHIEPFARQVFVAFTAPLISLLIGGWYQRGDLKMRFFTKGWLKIVLPSWLISSFMLACFQLSFPFLLVGVIAGVVGYWFVLLCALFIPRWERLHAAGITADRATLR